MRQQEDGDIKPTKDAMEDAYELIDELLNIVSEVDLLDEDVNSLKSTRTSLKRAIKKASSQTGT
tara:strand:+ start:49 stop:240 length:192 start_codon:yes stop_codon:yes gene_type:complete